MLDFVGRLHPVLVHFPIAVLIVAVLMQWMTSLKGFRKLRKSIRFLLMLGFLSAVASAITGYVHAQQGEFDAELVQTHQMLGIAVTVLAAGAVLMNRRKEPEAKAVGVVVLFLLLIVVVLTGHTGGTLTHGDGFLRLSGSATREPLKMNPDDEAFAALVNPILEKKCISCHGPSRQKGKLRLDAPEWIAKGGKNGSVLGSGDKQSELVHRIMLENSDEDRMPPPEKTALSVMEKSILRIWIEGGADFHAKVSALPELSALNLAESVEPAEREKVPPASSEIISRLQKMGASVAPLSADDGRISIQLMNVDSAAQHDVLVLCQQVERQLTELKLTNVKLTPEDWEKVGLLKGLKRLDLRRSNVSDEVVLSLNQLMQLKVLNVSQTKVTAKGLTQLSRLALQYLVVFETPAAGDSSTLAAAFSGVKIERGQYQIPLLPGDTSLQKTRYQVPAN